jgi:hypothetical protein
MENEVCENCGRVIGKLEQAFVYESHIVCKQCYKHLYQEPQEIPVGSGKKRQTSPILVIGVLSIVVIIVVVLSIFMGTSSSPIRGMTFVEVEQFVRAWNAGELPGMKLYTKEQSDRLAEAESELAEITRGEYKAWYQKEKQRRDQQYQQWRAQQSKRGATVGSMPGGAAPLLPYPDGDVSAFGFARLLKQEGAASQSLLKQLEIVEKLRKEIPAGPSFEVWERYENESLPGRRSLYYPVKRGVDQSRAMFYRTFGMPERRSLEDGVYHFYYRCKDEVAEFTVLEECFNLDCVSIMSVRIAF